MPRFPLLLLLAAACTAHRSGDVVRAVRFTVPDRPALRAPWAPTSNRSLRGAMVQRDSSWLSLVVPGAVEPKYLERSALPKDEQRLEVWLGEHGYFDATFGAWEVERHGQGRREIKPVTVRATLDAGPRSLLRDITLDGIDDVGPRLRRGLRSTTALAAGRPFDLEETKAGIAAVRARLAEVGYAFSTVTGEVHAFPEEGAVDVVVTVTPGVRSRYGPVELVGVKDVPRIIVADTGPGIDAEHRSQLFKPFQRLGAERTGIEGTGIGLVISRRLAEAMGGSIGFDSQPGEGSRFWLELPLDRSIRSDAAETAPMTACMETPVAPHAEGKVIYVEDNPTNVTVMRHVFRRLPGVELLTAENAEEGLAMIRTNRPDLVLMDINLPGMSGLDALRILKADPVTAAIPVIAVSAAAMPRDIQSGLDAGFRDYLTKPFDVQALLSRIREILQDSRR